MLTFPLWAERTAAARAAAAEAARAAVLADIWEHGVANADKVVAEIAVNHGLDPGDLTLELTGRWDRGEEITATVTVTIPAADLPGVGWVGSLTRTYSHTEHIDDYRSLR